MYETSFTGRGRSQHPRNGSPEPENGGLGSGGSPQRRACAGADARRRALRCGAAGHYAAGHGRPKPVRNHPPRRQRYRHHHCVGQRAGERQDPRPVHRRGRLHNQAIFRVGADCPPGGADPAHPPRHQRQCAQTCRGAGAVGQRAVRAGRKEPHSVQVRHAHRPDPSGVPDHGVVLPQPGYGVGT